MGTARRFEELRVWSKARALCARIDEHCSTRPLAANYALSNQMRRAATSIASNIAEGFELRSPRNFRHFLRIAKGSAAELRSQLYFCEDRGYLDPRCSANLRAEAEEVERMLSALITYLTRTLNPKDV
jgi:four helix bundle protein